MPLSVCYRVAAWDTPLWVGPNRAPGRWNRQGGRLATQYLSLHPWTPWAERARIDERRTVEEIRQLRQRLWAVRVDVAPLLRLGFGDAERLGFEPAALVDDDWHGCWTILDRLLAERPALPGLVVPSAALPGTDNVVLFGPRVAGAYLAEPLGAVDLPVGLLTEDGQPPDQLAELVCHVGGGNAGLAAHRVGDGLVFTDPAVPFR